MLVSSFIALLGLSIGKATSLAPRTRTSSDNVEDSHELHRRQNTALTTGTLTITVAPDPTCGYDLKEDPLYCSSSKRCSWESGRINFVFCDLRHIYTACLDRTDALDPDVCDEECLDGDNTMLCALTDLPYCVPVEFSGSISNWVCGPTSSAAVVFSTLDLVPRDFTTLILVDGTPVSSWTGVRSTSTKPKSTITVTAPTETDTSEPSPPPKDNDLNVGAVVGGVVGGVAILSLTALGIMIILRRNRKKAAPNNTSPDSAIQSNAPEMRSAVSSPTLNQPYSPTASSPVQHSNVMSPLPAYQQPDPYGPAVPGYQNAHELAGWGGDQQTGSPPGFK